MPQLIRFNYILTLCLLSITLLWSCKSSKEKNETDLVANDISKANNAAASDKVLLYKMIKIAAKVIGTSDSSNTELKEIMASLNQVNAIKDGAQGQLSVSDMFSLYSKYKSLKKNIGALDEDKYQTLTEAFTANAEKTKYDPAARKVLHNYEHGLLSILGFSAQNVADDIALYESLHTNSTFIVDNETRSLVQLIQGILYFEKKYYYLSERECTKNIDYLEKETFAMPITKAVLGQDSMNEAAIGKHFLALNYLLRFITREQMKRAIDQQNAIEDLRKFVAYTKTVNSDDELSLNAELLLYLKTKDYANASKIVEKLKALPTLSANQKKDYKKIGILLKANEKSNIIEEKINIFKILYNQVAVNMKKVDFNTLLKNAKMDKSLNILKEYAKMDAAQKILEESANLEKVQEEAEEILNTLKEGFR